MRPLRFACLFVIAIRTMMLGQSNNVPPINQSAKVIPPAAVSGADPKAQAKILDTYGKLPLSFEANQGQTDSQVKFLSRGSGYTLFLTGDEAVFSLRSGEAKGYTSAIGDQLHPMAVAPTGTAVLRMKLVKANHAAKVTGLDELPGKSNYFIGNDPKKWHSDVPTYSKVRYEGIYSGIDLVYYGNQRQLEYDFVVAPGADPRRITFDVRGAKRIRREEHGDLVFKMDEGEIRWRRPIVYQEKGGLRQKIASQYAVKRNRVEFEIGNYDVRRPLFIDPLVYSTYLGGSEVDTGNSIAVDSSGNAYVTGETASSNFPTMNPLQPTNNGGGNITAFVTKINPSGSALVYSTYLGGSGGDWGNGIALDSSGDVYLTGGTDSTDFPTMNPLQPSNGGAADAFVAKINPSGSALVYSTYLGGSGSDAGSGIAVDNAGNAYVTGATSSTDFPTMNPLQPSNGGGLDVFMAKINPSGSALIYSTYLGGSENDSVGGIAVDSLGNAYVNGQTSSTNFPTMNPLQPAYGGGIEDAFVSELNPTGSALVYSTYLGGSGIDFGFGIAVDSSGNAYVIGGTSSTNFPTMNPLQPANGGGDEDAFVAKINPSGSALVYSSYLGGSGQDWGVGIAIDTVGNAYLTGFTSSTDFPTMNPLQPANAGGQDAFVAKINPSGSALIYSTYLGGGGDDVGQGIAADSTGSAYVTGYTGSANFPTMNPFQPKSGGGGDDAFVTKIGMLPAVTLSPTSLTFSDQTIFTTSAAKPVTLTNTGSGTLLITKIGVNGSFNQTNDCGKSVKPGVHCTINVKFDPKTKGLLHGTLSVTDNAPGSPQTVPLTGTGTYVELSPMSVNFGTQPVGTKSLPKTITLTNKGSVPVSISGISITGTDPSDFAETNTCGKSVAAGASCFIKVTFKPLVKGKRTAAVSISDNGGGSPQKVGLTGTGT